MTGNLSNTNHRGFERPGASLDILLNKKLKRPRLRNYDRRVLNTLIDRYTFLKKQC